MKLFDIVADLSFEKNDLLRNANRDELLHEYNPFMINRAFSMYPDTIMYAEEMNGLRDLDKDMQHDYFLRAIPKKKRFGWVKGEKQDSLVAIIAKVYKINLQRAKEIMDILTPEQLTYFQKRAEYLA